VLAYDQFLADHHDDWLATEIVLTSSARSSGWT